MTRDEYYNVIANSVVLLAYQPELYRWRDSGLYHEAKLLDTPALVSAGTWMEQEVATLGNGLVIGSFTADAAVDAIMRAHRELPVLKAAAERVGRAPCAKRTASLAVSRCSKARVQNA